MQKVVLPLTDEGTSVSAHFGSCPQYLVVEVEGKLVQARKTVENPQGAHQGGCQAVDFIQSLGADVVITGGMGQKAIQKFNDFDIQVILGHTGQVEDILNAYIAGGLVSSGSACTHHH
jgi:ATP-binding protein involved in chromosome partitioning